MFLENTVNQKEQFGRIEVICGSMFSGKIEKLFRRLKRAQFAKQSKAKHKAIRPKKIETMKINDTEVLKSKNKDG